MKCCGGRLGGGWRRRAAAAVEGPLRDQWFVFACKQSINYKPVDSFKSGYKK